MRIEAGYWAGFLIVNIGQFRKFLSILIVILAYTDSASVTRISSVLKPVSFLKMSI